MQKMEQENVRILMLVEMLTDERITPKSFKNKLDYRLNRNENNDVQFESLSDNSTDAPQITQNLQSNMTNTDKMTSILELSEQFRKICPIKSVKLPIPIIM